MKFRLNDSCTKLILIDSEKNEFNQLKLHLSRYVKGYRFQQRFKLGVWDGKINYFNNGSIDFGLWKEVKNCCDEYGYKFEIENQDKFPRDNDIKKEDIQKFCDEFYEGYKTSEGKEFKPHDHQIEAIFRLLKYKYGLVEVATAGGKSLIFATMVFYILRKINPNAKILLVVPNISLVVQFFDDFLDYNLGYNKEQKTPLDIKLMEIMSDKPRKLRDGEIPNIYISTYQSLLNMEPSFMKQFDVVCTDESHKCKSLSLKTILSRTFGYAKYRIGMSGTYPEDGTAEYFTIQSLMGPKLFTVRARELIDKGLIANVKIKALILQHNDPEFSENVFMIKKRGGGKKAYELEKQYVQNSEKRKYFLMKLVNKFTQNSIVLFHNIDYGTGLYEFFRNNIQGKDFYYIDGETPSEQRNYIKKQMEDTTGNVKILVSSFGTTSVGLSIKAVVNLVFADSFKSDQVVRQSLGRILRLHAEKEKAILFDITDQFHKSYKNILYNHYISRRDQIYKKQGLDFDELKITI
jgi:superfamily II DNA or RNA helicase